MNSNRPPLLLVPPGQRGKDKQLRIDQYLPNPKRPRKPDNNPPNPPPSNTNKPTAAADEATTAAHVIRLPTPGAVLQPPAAAIATENSQGGGAGGAFITSAVPSSLVTTISSSSHHQHSQVSSLSLEAYIQLYSALTKGTGIVQQVNSIEEPFYKITDLRALLDAHGLVFTRNKKRDLLDRLVGLRLVPSAQQQRTQLKSQQLQTQPQPQPPAAVHLSAGVCGRGGGPGDGDGDGDGNGGKELGADSIIQHDGDTELLTQKQKPQNSREVREWQVAFRVPEAVDLAALAGWAAAAAGGGGGGGGSGAGSLEAQQALQEAMSAAAVLGFGIPAAIRALAADQVDSADGVDGDRNDDNDDDDDDDDDNGVSFVDDDGGGEMTTKFLPVEGGIGRRGGNDKFGSLGSLERKPAAADVLMGAKAAAAAMVGGPLPRASGQGFDDGDGARGSWTVGLHPALDPDPDPEPNSDSVRLPIPGHQRQPVEVVLAELDFARKGGAELRAGSEATTANRQEALQPQPQPQQRQHEQQGQQQLSTNPQLLLQELLQQPAAHHLLCQSKMPPQQLLLQQLLQQLLLQQQQQKQQQLQSTATVLHQRAGGSGEGCGGEDAKAGPSTAAGDVLYSRGPQQQLLILGAAGAAGAASRDGAGADGDSGGDDGRDRGACSGDADAVGFQGLHVELHGDVHAVEVEYTRGEEEEEEEEVMPPDSLGPQDSRPAVSVLQWLAPEVITFSQAHTASPEPLISIGQLVGRRVAFALVTQFRYMDSRAGEEVLPPGIYQGRVTESLGCACQPDVCGAGWDGEGEVEVQEGPCTRSGEHSFFFVRVITQPHLGIRGRLELKLDLSAATRVATFQELVGLTMGQLEDAWVLIGGPVAAQEGPMGRSVTGSGVADRPYLGWGTGMPPCRRGQGSAGALVGSRGGGEGLTEFRERERAGAGGTGMSMRPAGRGSPAVGRGAGAGRGMSGYTGRVGRGAAARSRCTAQPGGRGAKATLDGTAGRKRRANGTAGDDENGG